MRNEWHTYLQQHAARIESGVVRDFGDATAERQVTDNGAALADLSHLALLEFSGADAEAFLQGQLSCDVKAIAVGEQSLGSYCTPKGRMLASFFLVRLPDRFLMLLSTSLAAAIHKRLKMFVLRSKVTINDITDTRALLGLSSRTDASILEKARGDCAALPETVTVALGSKRLIVFSTTENAPQLWQRLSAYLRPVGTGCWEWLDIQEGLPLITAATQDQLVPQMANLELIGGVSFKKGCYPGQEIVARTQYLGKVKRRMFRAHLEVPANPGESLYSDDLGDQASGLVVAAQPAPSGGYDLLAVARLDSQEGSVIRLKAPDGPPLRFDALPYELS
jgi:tRNA-modifying protein YgfZ